MTTANPHGAPRASAADGPARPWRDRLAVFAYSRQAIALVWTTNRGLTLALMLLAIGAGLVPGAIAWVGRGLVDAVVAASAGEVARSRVLGWVVAEGVLVVVLAAAQRGMMVVQSLLRAQLGQRVNVMILEKALTLELAHFEDSEFYDKLTRARREASTPAAVSS